MTLTFKPLRQILDKRLIIKMKNNKIYKKLELILK